MRQLRLESLRSSPRHCEPTLAWLLIDPFWPAVIVSARQFEGVPGDTVTVCEENAVVDGSTRSGRSIEQMVCQSTMQVEMNWTSSCAGAAFTRTI